MPRLLDAESIERAKILDAAEKSFNEKGMRFELREDPTGGYLLKTCTHDEIVSLYKVKEQYGGISFTLIHSDLR